MASRARPCTRDLIAADPSVHCVDWSAQTAARAGPARPGGGSANAASRLPRLREGRGHERLLQRGEDAGAALLLDELQAAELEPRKLHATGGAQREEAEVGEEVVREDRLVDEEPLGEGLALAVAVG